MPSTASMAREDILCVGARIWPAALFTRMSSGRFCQMRSIIASTASGRRTSHLTVSISAPVSQPETSALDVPAQTLHPLRRRGPHGDVGRCRTALSRPSSAIESNGVTAILPEVDDPHDVAFGTYAAAMEVAHGRVDRAAGMDRLAVTWRAQLIIAASSATVIAVLRP